MKFSFSIGWEGGDEWLRSQFKLYLLSVMRTAEIDGNCLFISLKHISHEIFSQICLHLKEIIFFFSFTHILDLYFSSVDGFTCFELT